MHFVGKNGFVSATTLGTKNKFFVAATQNFAAATKRFVDITKHFGVVTKYFCYPYFNKLFWWYNKTFYTVYLFCFTFHLFVNEKTELNQSQQSPRLRLLPPRSKRHQAWPHRGAEA